MRACFFIRCEDQKGPLLCHTCTWFVTRKAPCYLAVTWERCRTKILKGLCGSLDWVSSSRGHWVTFRIVLKRPEAPTNLKTGNRQVQPCWDFNNSIMEFRVPVSLALSLCQYVLRPRRGLGQASPSLEAPRLQALETGPLSST